MPGFFRALMSKKQAKRGATNYVNGAVNATRALAIQAASRGLSPEAAMALLVTFGNTLDAMRKAKDTANPFLSRAMAKSLEAEGIESYESALANMRPPETIKQSPEEYRPVSPPVVRSTKA